MTDTTERIKQLEAVLQRIADWDFDLDGDCVREARQAAVDVLTQRETNEQTTMVAVRGSSSSKRFGVSRDDLFG